MSPVRLIFPLAIVAAIGIGEGTPTSSVRYSPVVQLPRGKVQGLLVDVEDGQPVNVFHGIRYGRADRFSKSKLVEKWDGVYNATKFQFACPQKTISYGQHPKGGYMAMATSEDCLFLSVWAPAKKSSVKRPVMVWIHGGGFMMGSELSYTNDGKFLASYGDLVVVGLNYRLGILGFLYGGDDAPANLGLLDQVLALQFVQESIEAFGGDPKRLTIFGESAGSMSVGALVLSPLASGLFHRAIMQSGAPLATAVQSKADALKSTKVAATRLKCPTSSVEQSLACIRNKTVPELMAIEGSLLDRELALWPVYGDDFLPVKPADALKTGKFNHNVDLLFGVVRDEAMSVFASMFKLTENSTSADLSIDTAKQVINLMFGIIGATDSRINTTEIGEFYLRHVNESNPFEIRKALSNAFGDYFLVCPTILFAEAIAKFRSHGQTFFSYRLMQTSSVGAFGCDPPSIGVCHATDVLFTFGVPIQLRGILFTDDDYYLSKNMILSWTSYVKSGQPGKIDGVQWTEAFNRDPNVPPETSYMSLHVRDYKMVSGHYQETCEAFWKQKIF